MHTRQVYIFTSSELRDGGSLSDGQVNALHHHPVSCRHSTDLDGVTSLRHPQSTNLVIHTNIRPGKNDFCLHKHNNCVKVSTIEIIRVYALSLELQESTGWHFTRQSTIQWYTHPPDQILLMVTHGIWFQAITTVIPNGSRVNWMTFYLSNLWVLLVFQCVVLS